MIKSAADFIMGVWTAPEVPLLIEYPLDIMEELRALLCDELQRLSRGGGDVAGVLFGVSRGAAIRVMTWRGISRAAPEEQSPRMSRHDRAEMVRVLGMAASDPAMQGFEPLGWFVSHAEGGTGLTSADIDLFENFFPNSWQVTLLLRRGPGGTARAGFFVREPDGSLRPDASYRELFVQPVRRVPGSPGPKTPLSAVPPPAETQLSEARHKETPWPVETSRPLTETPHASVETSRPIAVPSLEITAPVDVVAPDAPPAAAVPHHNEAAASESIQSEASAPPEQSDRGQLSELPDPVADVPAAMLREPQQAVLPPAKISKRMSIIEPPKPARPAVFLEKVPAELPAQAPPAETPNFTLQAHSFGGARWLWIGLGLLALALVIFLVMQRNAASPVASFALRVAALGDSIEISWDRDSTPVWNGQRASVKIQDGPDTKQLSLSSDQLRAGKTTYARETPDVAIEMTIYDTVGHEYHEFARFIAPAPYAPAPPAPQSHDSSELRTERDRLAAEVERLKENVRKEGARADQAEDLVRILENRLKIDDGRTRSSSQK